METTPTQASASSMGTPRTQSSTTRYTWSPGVHKRAVGALLLSHRPSELRGGGEELLVSSNFPLLSEQEWSKGPCMPWILSSLKVQFPENSKSNRPAWET